ncbi:MAG: topoisomerase C-terminal repeat-containing protein [Patescibacteria group bacterium]
MDNTEPKIEEICDRCGKTMVLRSGRYGEFLACTGYPDCKNTINIVREGVKQEMHEDRLIGDDPETKKPVYLKEGRYGTYIQLGDSEKGRKPKTASLLRGMDAKKLNLDTALELLTLPKTLGTADDGEIITVSNGKFGPYIKAGKETRSLPSNLSPLKITLDEARDLLKGDKLRPGGKSAVINLGQDEERNDIIIKEGKFGPYITNGKINVSVPKTITSDSVTLEDAIAMLEKKAKKIK